MIPSVWSALGTWVVVLAALMIVVTFGVIIAALFGRIRPAQPRLETPGSGTRNDGAGARLDRQLQAEGLARAVSSSRSFALGVVVATLAKRRRSKELSKGEDT